jgi:hypothetical protein
MSIRKLFKEQELINKIQDNLPKLFQIAELESSRAGRGRMEIGSVCILLLEQK